MPNTSGLKPFKKGAPGGPGRPKDPPELSLIMRMTKPEFELLMQKLLKLSPAEMEEHKGSVLEMAMIAIIKKAIDHGDHWRLQFFIERLFGKVTDKLEVNDKSGYGAKLDRFRKPRK